MQTPTGRPPAGNAHGLLWQGALVLTVTSWALAGVIGRHIALEVPPVTLSAIRFGLGGLLVAGLNGLILKEPRVRTGARGLGWLAILALLGVVLQLPLFHLALAYTTATKAMLIWSFSPVFVGLGTVLYLRQPVTWRKWAGIGAGSAGLALLLLAEQGGKGELAGDLLALVTCVAMAGFTLLVRRLGNTFSPLAMTVKVHLLGTLMILPLASLEAAAGRSGPNMVRHWPSILFLVLATGLGRWLWNAGISRLGAVETSVYMYLQPVLTAVLAYLFIGEPLTLPVVAGGALVLLGTAWVQTRDTSRREVPTNA